MQLIVAIHVFCIGYFYLFKSEIYLALASCKKLKSSMIVIDQLYR